MTTQTSSDMLPKAPTFPRIIIQPDWFVNVKSNILPTDVWLEFKAGSSSISRLTQNIHGVCSIKAASDPDTKTFKTSGSDKFQSGDVDRSQQQLRIKIQDSEFSHTFQGPMNSYTTSGKQDSDNGEFDPLVNVPELPKSRTNQSTPTTVPHWFDISSGGVGLAARSNGTITIWDLNNGDVRRKLRGHVEDVYVARFFPSDLAVVSGGADMRVKIWSLNSENDQIRDTTLTGHQSRINDVHPLDQQRVLSASNDGSVILWDITKNQAVRRVVQLDSISINAITLTNGSSLACACNDGLIRLYDFNQNNANQPTHQMKIGSTLNTICYQENSQQFIYGTEQSSIGIYDARNTSDTPIYAWKEQRGKINCVTSGRNQQGLLATSSDGSCFEYNEEELKNMSDTLTFHVYDYTGADDSVTNAKVYQEKVYANCRDGLIRVYGQHAEK